MRILVVSPIVPYPPMSGFPTRVYQLVRRMARRHDVTLLTYAEPGRDDDLAALRSLCDAVVSVPRVWPVGAAKRAAQLRAAFSPDSYQWRGLRSAAMQGAIDGVIARGRFDAIQVESSQMAGFTFGRGPALVIDEHNIEYELLERTYREERSPLRRAHNWLEFRKFRAEEERHWRRADGLIVTSERESSIVGALLPQSARAVVPNGVDIEYFVPGDATPDRDTLVFTGLLSYRPNQDAVTYFVREVLPLIRRIRPSVTFTVVGANVPPEIARLASPVVRFTGRVPDVRDYVRRSAVFVVPLRMGSGTRLKVLEGLAMAKPMVSTTLGCEGIDVRDGQHLLIADEPESITRAVLRLLDDPPLGARLACAGRALVESRYSWASVGDRLEAFLARIAPAPAGVDSAER